MVTDFDFRALGTGHSLVFLRLIVKPKVDAVMRMGMQSCEEHAEEDFADNAHERDNR